MHGRTQWRWGRYRRIGIHRYRRRRLYRNVHGHFRYVRGYWHLWKRNHYYKPNRWEWGRTRRVGHHLYRKRTLFRWTGARWTRIRSYWHLAHRNKVLLQESAGSKHRMHGRTQWRWGRYRRIGIHRYRRRRLYRNVHGHFRYVRGYWHL